MAGLGQALCKLNSTISESIAQAIVLGVAPLFVSRGSIVHSNHIKPDGMLQAMMSDPTPIGQGLNPQIAAAVIQFASAVLQSKSMTVQTMGPKMQRRQ